MLAVQRLLISLGANVPQPNVPQPNVPQPNVPQPITNGAVVNEVLADEVLVDEVLVLEAIDALRKVVMPTVAQVGGSITIADLSATLLEAR